MEIATIEVKGVHARLAGRGRGRWEIPAGLVGGTVRLRYGADWKGLTKTVVFDGCGVTKDVVNAGETVTIPAEVVSRPERKLLVGFYGVGEDGTATPTLWLEGYVCAAADPSGDTSTDPSLPVWSQLEARIRALEERNFTVSVRWELSHVTAGNPAEEIPYGGSFSTALTAESGFELAAVTVLMGGGDITKAAYTDGKIQISPVTGDLVIRAEAMQKQAEFAAYSAPVKTGSALTRSGTAVSATENWLYTDYIPAVPGQCFRYVGDTSAYSEYASVWGYGEGGSPVSMLVDNGNHLAGVEFTVPEGVYALRFCGHASAECSLEVRADQARMAGEAEFLPGLVVSGTGAESAKAGGGVTDYLSVHAGDLVAVYNIVPLNGGRFAFYDGEKKFLSAETVYDQADGMARVASTRSIPENAAYVRISTNVAEGVRGAVIREG